MALNILTIVNRSRDKRSIRSYVRRESRMTPAQRQALVELWPKYGIDSGSPLGNKRLFQNKHPIILEIGFGDGQNLINLALTHLDNNYVGIDVYRPGVGRLLIELERLAIRNVHIILNDVVEVLPNHFKENSLDSVLIYFPDPWPKKRHHKRRLLSPNFLHELALRLMPTGILYIATDCVDYAQSILNTIDEEELLENMEGPSCYAREKSIRIVTKYEGRALQRGYNIRDIQARRL